MKPTWLWLKNTVVLVADSFEAAKAEYDRLQAEFPNNTLYESTACYDSDGKYRAIF
jgi:hypothetical protein